MTGNARQVKTHIFEQLALVGKALANAARMEILDILCQAERTVEVLADESSQSVANTSRHLQVLRQAGLVFTRREKNFVVYSISGENVCRLWRVVQAVGGEHLAEIEKTVSRYFEKKDELDVLDRKDILRRAATGEIVLVDVRPEEEYRHSHIKGACSVPLKDLKKRLAELPKNKTVVAYCRGPYCVLSQEAVKLLKGKGLNAMRMADSVMDWKKQRLAVEGNG